MVLLLSRPACDFLVLKQMSWVNVFTALDSGLLDFTLINAGMYIYGKNERQAVGRSDVAEVNRLGWPLAGATQQSKPDGRPCLQGVHFRNTATSCSLLSHILSHHYPHVTHTSHTSTNSLTGQAHWTATWSQR